MKKEEKMPAFEYYIIYGNEKEGVTSKDYEQFGKAVEKHGLKLVFRGGPFGVSEGSVMLLKGHITGFEKLFQDSETFNLFPITNNRTVSVYIM